MALLELLKGMAPGVTTHGFRSSFSDWAHDRTAYAPAEIELALAHVVGNKVAAAYRQRRCARQAPAAHGRVGEISGGARQRRRECRGIAGLKREQTSRCVAFGDAISRSCWRRGA